MGAQKRGGILPLHVFWFEVQVVNRTGKVFRSLQLAFDERLIDHQLGRDIGEFTPLPRSTCLRMGRKLSCIRSTPTEIQATNENDFECLSSTGANTSETMFPDSRSREMQLPRGRPSGPRRREAGNFWKTIIAQAQRARRKHPVIARVTQDWIGFPEGGDFSARFSMAAIEVVPTTRAADTRDRATATISVACALGR